MILYVRSPAAFFADSMLWPPLLPRMLTNPRTVCFCQPVACTISVSVAFASWRLSAVPRFLAAEDVERVIDSCTGYIFESRDRAVLLLLARLALRASEVAQLKFTDIDWRNGGIGVCGKGRRQESLPLPQEVGDAILRYVNKGRPLLQAPEVFTTVLAPFHPLTRAAVTHIVRAALRRAGIKAPINGAHVLRHSAATTMLRQGASLAGVGAVLRHRSPTTTAHYAKVDFGLLSEIARSIAQPARVRHVRGWQKRYTCPRFDGGGLGDGGSLPTRSLHSVAKCRAPGSILVRRGFDPRGAAQFVSRVHAATPALHLCTRGDYATRRSGQSASRVVPTSTPGLRDVGRADCLDRAPHLGGTRPPALRCTT